MTRTRNFNAVAECNVRVITRIVHDVLDRCDQIDDAGELVEVVKNRCASLHVPYNTGVVTKAIAAADFQRVRVGKPPSHPSSAGAVASRMQQRGRRDVTRRRYDAGVHGARSRRSGGD